LEQSTYGFIKKLVDINDAEVREYTSEIKSNREFHRQLEENRGAAGGRRFYSWNPGISAPLGTALYVICRKLRPDNVVETGVAGGVSSSYILCALETNNNGKLYSIDLPWAGTGESGWLIPDYLRHRWQLLTGRSSEKLTPLLRKLGEIDVFLHDSEHTYRNMLWEYETVWTYLKSGGILLSHNVDYSDAFPDFCDSAGVKGVLHADTGGTVKP